MKHQKVASRKERLIFENLVQEDKVTKSSGNNFNSQRVDTYTQHNPSINNMNNNQNLNRVNSNQTTENITKKNPGSFQQNLNPNLTRDNHLSNNSSEKFGVNNLSKRDRIWKERRNKKINSEKSENSNLVRNISSHNQMKQINNIATPLNIAERNQLNTITRTRVDSIQTPNQNAQVYNQVSRTNTQSDDFNQNIKPIKTGNINNRLERTNTTPLPVEMKSHNNNFRQNQNNNTTFNNPIREANNVGFSNTPSTNQNYSMNNVRINPSSYAVTPNNNPIIMNIPNQRQSNQIQYNTSSNYPLNTPSNIVPINTYNSVATPGNNLHNNYGMNRKQFLNQTNASQTPMQFSRAAPPQYNNTATPISNTNPPMRNIFSHTPLPIGNINQNYSKPGSSQSNKPFASENISFRNTNNITPGNNSDRIYSSHLGRENNKFIFDKKNVIY